MFRCKPTTWYGLLLLLSVATSSGRELPDAWFNGIYVGSSPRPVPALEENAWRLASTLAENSPDAFVLVGSGRSMQPLYHPGTILVLRHVPFDDLRRGQTVLYRNRDRKVIAHVLVSQTHDGWRVRGLNNASPDPEPVQADNLVGVVVAAFHPVPAGHDRAALNASHRLPVTTKRRGSDPRLLHTLTRKG